MKDVTKITDSANRAVSDSDNKANTKDILRTFVDKITFNKETKTDYLVYTHISVKKQMID